MRTTNHNRFTILLQICLCVVFLSLVYGCGSIPLYFEPLQPVPPDQFTNDPWDEILKDHVGGGRVDYTGIRHRGMEKLNEYLDLIAHTDPNAFNSDRDKLAFWINAYNAFVVQGIINGYTTGNMLGRYRFFFRAKYEVGGKEINLWGIKNKIIRKEFDDPRIHFVLVSANRGGPILRSRAYEGARLDAMLEMAAREFINNDDRYKIDRQNRTMYLSKIFDWYKEDFSKDDRTVKTYFLGYLDLPVEEKKPLRAYRIDYLKYDWNLNGPPLD